MHKPGIALKQLISLGVTRDGIRADIQRLLKLVVHYSNAPNMTD